VTPEGVDLRLRLASAGARAGAFMIDAAIMFVGLIAVTILLIVVGANGPIGSGEVIGILWLLGFFILRNGYFLGFELGARAATPGKRALGLRVIARDGGRLTGGALIARNTLRELEVSLPLTGALVAWFTSLTGSSDRWAALAGLLWVCVFLFFPLFNRDRLRVGDLVAGTWVVHTPRRRLGHSMVDTHHAPRFVFTEEQLGAYGEYELKTLEDVLRREEELALIVVARSIRTRIGWTGPEDDDYGFLHAYYAALCQRLERNMLFGKRRRDKYDRG